MTAYIHSNSIKNKNGKKNNNKPYKGYHIPYYHKIKEHMYRLQGSLPYTHLFCSVTPLQPIYDHVSWLVQSRSRDFHYIQ